MIGTKVWTPALALAVLLVAPPPVVDSAPASAAEGGDRAGAKYYERGVRYARSGNNEKALEWFEKALPHQNRASDIFYNLVNLSEALKKWERIHLYASGFLFLESDTQDAKAIRDARDKAARALEERERAAVPVTFEVEPAGTLIYVDHTPVVRSGRRPVELPPGTYTARADKDGHHPFEKEFEVVAGAPSKVEGALEAIIYQGFLKVVTRPAEGVKVYVDDELVGTTPLEDPIELETRRYLVRFEKDGWDQWIRYVDIEKDQTHRLEPRLERTVNGEVQRAK